MKLNKKIFYGMLFLIIIVLFSDLSLAYMNSNVQTFQFSTGVSNFTQEMCKTGQDFLIQIVPFGCTPAVVRTDLLEENDVSVFCQLGATKINPLIDVEAIDSISFSGTYPKEVAGIGFHPAKAALGVETDLNTPVLDNIGYVVITLKKQANASAIPDYITGNLTAKISYNIKTAFGIGNALFYIPEFSNNEEWEAQKYKYGFWGNKGYLKVDEITNEGAQISVYTDSGKISTVSLKKGETSGDIYIPGFECQAGLKLKLESLENPDTRAQLRVNAEVVEVAKGEKFLDNKCQVRDLVTDGLVQKVGLKCQEDTGVKNFDLTISPRLILNINGEDKEFGLGEELYRSGDRGIYLAYIGTKDDAIKAENLFVYLVSIPQKEGNLTEEELSSITSLVGDLTSAGQKSTGIIDKIETWMEVFAGLGGSLSRAIGNGEILYRLNFEDKAQDFQGGKVSIIDFAGVQDKELSRDIKEQYENAKEDYETIIESFSSELYQGTTTYGEEALYKEITLAWDAGQKRTVLDLCKEFAENYPDSDKDTRICSDASKLSSQETGETYLTINNEIKKISFDGISEPSFDEYGVRIMANTPQGTLYFDLRKNQYASEAGLSLQLISAEENSARVQISVTTSKGTKTKIVNLEEDITNDFEEGYSFTLSQVNLKKVAKVSLIPNINNAGTNADFSFKIGIEKRAIQLSPDKIKQMIKDLDSSIGKWQNLSSVLGNVTQGLKTACLVTGAALVVENFFTNMGGKGIARQYVMRGTNGWFEKCTEMVSAGTYVSVDKCLVENSEKIDSDVALLSGLIEQQNSQIKKIEDSVTNKQVLSEKIVDTDAFVKSYSQQVNGYVKDNAGFQSALTDPSGKGEAINKNDILTILTYQGWEDGKYSTEQLRNIELYTEILSDSSSSSELKDIAKQRLYSVLSDVQINSRNYVEIVTWAGSLNNVNPDKIGFVETNEKVKKMAYEDLTLGSIGKTGLGGLGTDTPVALIQTSGNKEYIIILDKSAGTNILGIKSVYDSSGNLLESVPSELVGVVFQKYDAASYNNQYKNAKVRYYETEPYKGLPAIVPFDLNKGWYAAIKPTLPTGSNIASYDASARLNSFYLCNVGQNGNEEFQTVGDDICQMINLGTGQAYNVFPGLGETEAKNTIDRAVQAVEQASKSYKSGLSGKISILGEKVDVGSPAVDIPEFECQDFMSPKDCLLLFNVCDPVICPSSRCDLGGAYPVRDVVQSGIIGSIVLCLPNAKEGIIVPVCLTGIKAGIDGFLSVQQSYRDCLQESLDTGKMIGICDEVYSIYICDFFWRQALPFADLIIPKIIETLLGQNVRGGGEYLSVANAWDSAGKAVDYFVNYYGTNAKNAFIARTTEGFVDNICKAYASAVVPSGADLISELTSPDSPTQFHGRFDEIPMTTATVPPISHYKVFYHIYAGEDSGAYYQVYLRGVSGSSYYQDTASNLMVASGYVAVGGYASDTRDFTATSGYKELCINVNGQEECGFKEVSTSFALNYISDSYLASQVNQTNIKTESECISGSASAYNLLNPNAQSAAESLINPAIYDQGIIRICATENPGLGTDPYAGTSESRWKEVGICGTEKIKCWLDTESVEDVIKTTTVEGEALDSVTDNYLKILQNEGGYLNEEEFSSNLKEIKTEKDYSTRITLINEIINKVFWSSEKVELLYLRGNAYMDILEGLLSKLPKPKAAPEKAEEKPPVSEAPSEISSSLSNTVSSDEAIGSMDIIGLLDPQEKVILATIQLAGKSASRTVYDNCWEAVYQSYTNAQVGDSCVYSDASKKSYTIENERGVGGKAEITTNLYVKGKAFPTFAVYNCYYSSSGSNSLNSQQKLTYIQSGFLLSYAWRSDAGHNAIFIRWKDQGKRIAYLFDWNGGTKENPVFRYYTEDLSDDKHPVYVYWQPTSKTQSDISTIPIEDYPAKPEEETSTPTKSSSTISSPESAKTVGEKIWQAAENIATTGSNDNAAKFVSHVLIDAGVQGIEVTEISATIQGTIPESVDYLTSLIEKKNEFSEVNINDLKMGDIVLIGKGCQKNYSIAIFSTYSSIDNNPKISFYTNLKGKVNLETLPFITNIDNKEYVYKAYRYTKDTGESISLRAKWTLINAINEVNKRTGKYNDNQVFIDQLIFDGILTEKDCGDIRGTSGFASGLFNLQKDMNWLKKLLLTKCAQDQACRKVF
jgi:hypothetical protein